MPQLFSPGANVIARLTLFGGLFCVAGSAWAADTVYESSSVTGARVPIGQPVPFSHKHHVQDLGLDCRYCHQGVEKSADAGMPATETCMTCHSQLYTDQALLEPVRTSLETGVPIAWNRINTLPDYVYFDHSIHVKKGVACISCHGQVNDEPLMQKAQAFKMSFCIDCHRNPAPQLRPEAAVFAVSYPTPPQPEILAARLMQHYDIAGARLTNCSTCHR